MNRRFDQDLRNRYARSAQAWLALGAVLDQYPLTLRPAPDPIDD